MTSSRFLSEIITIVNQRMTIEENIKKIKPSGYHQKSIQKSIKAQFRYKMGTQDF